MKAERDDLVLRSPSVLKAPFELCGTNSDMRNRPDTPIRKVTRDLRRVAGAIGFARDRKCFLTELSRIFEDSNNPITSFLKKASPRGSQ